MLRSGIKPFPRKGKAFITVRTEITDTKIHIRLGLREQLCRIKYKCWNKKQNNGNRRERR